MAIRAPKTGHSLSAIFLVSPSPKGHFWKNNRKQILGNGGGLDGSRRDRSGDYPAIGSFLGKEATVR